MRLRRARTEPPRPTVYVGDYTHKLSRIRPVAHDDDNERQCREDLEYGKRLFGQSPVALPRFLTGGKKRG